MEYGCFWKPVEIGECAGTEVLLKSSIVELALQVYCNLVLKIIHCAGSGGVGLFYRKVFPHRKICVMCFFLYLFSVWLQYCCLHDIKSASVKVFKRICIILPFRD